MSFVAGQKGEATWFGQPRGLTVLFLTNMWEQFSYYGMRALLVYYMKMELLIEQRISSFIYGTYTAFAYFTPIFGGIIADRWLGKRRAVILGGSIMAAGHFMMTFEPLFYVALGTIALGNGFFLPSLPSQINDLYSAEDPRRPWAYNIYYVGINIGGFLAPLVCGTLGEFYGWHYGFGAAGIGMGIGLAIYVFGGRYLPAEDRRVLPEGTAGGGGFDKPTVMLLGALLLAVTVFRSAYEQVGNTVALWADSGVDRVAGAFEIPMTWFQSLNPMLVIMITPFLLAHWRRQALAGTERTPLRKMSLGALIVGAAYVMLAIATVIQGDGRASWLWLVGFFAIFTFGELYILPNGLGVFARLAPQRLGASTVASWFLAIFTGSLAGGLVGSFWSVLPTGLYFLVLAVICAVAALFLRMLDAPARQVFASRFGHEGHTVPVQDTNKEQ
ncbi:peptide MFS transporter [Croceicoccus naphthovorans]|uniref:Peptide ABC transporter n=1 Tax=Croceicoccus naphthovorans TaxID=1348774 RepID=A0A0G3XKF1_9SPHN|nr:peptide MFS transporter [Croceicoccus naphthovorans]AKM10893.1 peptide ABC transporter [Croceicoccus naphthovorans]MBB3989130.1 POT family proton-dependent oligopeptide transporter [Croceicoccus naphthovorans]